MAGKFQFTAKLDEQVDQCFRALTPGDEKFEKKFLKDTKWHDDAAKRLNKEIFNRIDELKPEELKKLIYDEDKNERAMMPPGPSHKGDIFNVIDNDFPTVKGYLTFIKDFAGDPRDIDKLLPNGSNGSKHIKGAAICFVTQLLTGAHLDEYVVYHWKLYEVLQNSGMLDGQGINCLKSKKSGAERYLCVNDICKQMYIEKFKERMEASYKFGLQVVHNFLWHYHYKEIGNKRIGGKGRWWDKDC